MWSFDVPKYETVCTKVRRLSERSVFLSHWPNGWKSIIIDLISMDLNVLARESFAVTLLQVCKVLCRKDLRLNMRVAEPEIMQVDDLQRWVERAETRRKQRIQDLENKVINYP